LIALCRLPVGGNNDAIKAFQRQDCGAVRGLDKRRRNTPLVHMKLGQKIAVLNVDEIIKT
jgi:hypothetical protein